MKKNALATLGIFAILSTGAIGISAKNLVLVNPGKTVISTALKVDAVQARKIALKKIDGKITEEFTIEDEDETVIAFVFQIETNAKKKFEVQVDADSGEVVYAEEIED